MNTSNPGSLALSDTAALRFMRKFCRPGLAPAEVELIMEIFDRLDRTASGHEVVSFCSILEPSNDFVSLADGLGDVPKRKTRRRVIPCSALGRKSKDSRPSLNDCILCLSSFNQR